MDGLVVLVGCLALLLAVLIGWKIGRKVASSTRIRLMDPTVTAGWSLMLKSEITCNNPSHSRGEIFMCDAKHPRDTYVSHWTDKYLGYSVLMNDFEFTLSTNSKSDKCSTFVESGYLFALVCLCLLEETAISEYYCCTVKIINRKCWKHEPIHSTPKEVSLFDTSGTTVCFAGMAY